MTQNNGTWEHSHKVDAKVRFLVWMIEAFFSPTLSLNLGMGDKHIVTVYYSGILM